MTDRGRTIEDRRQLERTRPANPALGKILQPLRNSRGLTRKRLAEIAGLDASSVSRLESGERGISRDVVDRLAQALKATSDEYAALLNAAGFLPKEAAILLEEPDLSGISHLLARSDLPPAHRELVRSYLRLALSHAEALGHDVSVPRLAPSIMAPTNGDAIES